MGLLVPLGLDYFFFHVVENFPNMEREIVNQVQEAQRVPYRINLRRKMPKYTLIKLTKTNNTKKEY